MRWPWKRRVPENPGTVYFMQSSICTKIGYTKGDPMERLAAMQTGNPHYIVLAATIAGSRQLERALHELFADYHYRGEWYEMPPRWAAKVRRWLLDIGSDPELFTSHL